MAKNNVKQDIDEEDAKKAISVVDEKEAKERPFWIGRGNSWRRSFDNKGGNER